MNANNYSCPICTNIIIFPRIYDCGHTVCEDCMIQIDEEINKISENSNGAPIYKCPICRKKTHKSWFNRPRNLFLISLLENEPEYVNINKKKYQNNPLDNIPQDVNLSSLCRRNKELKFNELYNYSVNILKQSSLQGKDVVVITNKAEELYRFSSKLSKKLFENHGIYKVISTQNYFKIFILDNEEESESGTISEYINENYNYNSELSDSDEEIYIGNNEDLNTSNIYSNHLYLRDNDNNYDINSN